MKTIHNKFLKDFFFRYSIFEKGSYVDLIKGLLIQKVPEGVTTEEIKTRKKIIKVIDDFSESVKNGQYNPEGEFQVEDAHAELLLALIKGNHWPAVSDDFVRFEEDLLSYLEEKE